MGEVERVDAAGGANYAPLVALQQVGERRGVMTKMVNNGGGRAYVIRIPAGGGAQDAPSAEIGTKADKKVPARDAIVTIDRGVNVSLDASPQPLHGMMINGKLSFADNKDLDLSTEWIMLHGDLEIGTEAKPQTFTDCYTPGHVAGIDGYRHEQQRTHWPHAHGIPRLVRVSHR